MPGEVINDLRPEVFREFEWYRDLTRDGFSGAPQAQALLGTYRASWSVDLLNLALHYARSKRLLNQYVRRLSGLKASAFTSDTASAENREATFPLWEIVNELVVAAYLEHVFAWRFETHEPVGKDGKFGDWMFVTPSGRSVFVEVKSLSEQQPMNTVFVIPPQTKRIASVLDRAYKQLPTGAISTLVVLVGDWLLDVSHGLVHGDVCATLLGQFELRLDVMQPEPRVISAGPSGNDKYVQRNKHKRLGAVAGLRVFGQHVPILSFYAVHNPFSLVHHQVPASDFGHSVQLLFEDGAGRQVGSFMQYEAWASMVRGVISVA